MIFRELLNELSKLNDEQLNQEVIIIPTGYAAECPVEFDGFEPFKGNVEFVVPKGDIVFMETPDSPISSSASSGCFDTYEDCPDESMYSEKDIIVHSGFPYLRISNPED